MTLDQPRTHNPVNEIETIGGSGSLIAQDAAGNMSKAPKPADWNSAFTMKYDAWNRLTQVKSGSKVVAQYAYNGFKWRVSKTAGGETRKYFYTNEWQVLEERVDGATAPDRQFVWGLLGKDNLVLRDRPSANERRYALSDYVSVTAITDATGAVLERYGYHAYGTPQFMDASFAPISGSTSEWETLYDSYRYDPETGYYQVRNRYLHPSLGRWITMDPIGYKGGINLYAYVNNASINQTDPTGLFPPAVVAAAAVIALVFACAMPQYVIAMSQFGNSGDKFRHCWVSCRIARTCGAVVAELAGIGKELRDMAAEAFCEIYPSDVWPCNLGSGHGDAKDHIDDLFANQQCITWETIFFFPIGGLIATLCGYTCERCCRKRVGYNN